MAGRFMKIKKVVIPFMTLVVMTSQLAGCATMSSDEMLKTMQESPDVSIEYAIPDEEQQTLDATHILNVDNGVVDSDADSEVGLIVDNQEKAELSGDELIEYFQLVYNTCSVLDTSYTEEQIAIELDMLVSFCDTDGKKLPSDYEQQYRAWRPTETEQTLEDQTPEVTLTFTDCNETVWATGTVNLRSGPSTEDDKVGSLNKNQSVTRIGIGTGDYSSWSKVKLSDGSEVYAASNYLTTTKPSTGSNQQGQQSSGQQSTSSQQQQGQTSDPSIPPGGYSSNPNQGFQEIVPGRDGSVANEGDVEYSGWIS